MADIIQEERNPGLSSCARKNEMKRTIWEYDAMAYGISWLSGMWSVRYPDSIERFREAKVHTLGLRLARKEQ
jgi:hypothetical protein